MKNGSRVEEYTYAKKTDLSQLVNAVAKTMAESEKLRIQQHNALADIVSSNAQALQQVSDAADGMFLALRFAMEKLGAIDADGNQTDEYKNWCAAQVAAVEALKAQQAVVDQPEAGPAPEAN